MTFRYESSIRARAIAQTLEYAKALAAELGITRVTDTTRLDRAGVPVFASIRPGADVGSLCVNAGKGLTLEQVQAQSIARDYDGRYGAPAGPAAPANYLATVYRSLTAEAAEQGSSRR